MTDIFKSSELEELRKEIRGLSDRVKELEIGLHWVIAELRKKKLLPPPG